MGSILTLFVALGYKTRLSASILGTLLVLYNFYANCWWTVVDETRDYWQYEFFRVNAIFIDVVHVTVFIFKFLAIRTSGSLYRWRIDAARVMGSWKHFSGPILEGTETTHSFGLKFTNNPTVEAVYVDDERLSRVEAILGLLRY